MSSKSNSAVKMSVVSTFGLTRHQLTELMCQRGADALSAVAEYGGVTGVMESMETNTKTGLANNPQELERRKSMFGVNYIKPIAPKSFLALCFDAIQDKTLIILIIAAVVSIVLGVAVEEDKSIAWIEGVAILGAVVIVVLVTAVNDWTKEKQFRGLQRRLETDAKFSVLREGNLEELNLAEIVVGDVLQFKYGNTFPVDGLLIQGYDVKVDEASLTGEAELVKKLPDRDVMLLAGTQVMEGGGRMVVTAVGPNSQQGIIFQLLTKREDDAGFIEKFFRDRVCKKCIKKPVDDEEANQLPALGSSDDKIGSPDDKSGSPYRKSKVAEAGVDDESEDELPPLPPLTGRDRLSISKRMKRRKELKEREKSKKKPEKTESGSVLQRKLNKLAIQIGYAGTIAAVVCFFILFFKFVIEDFGIMMRQWDSSIDFSEILHFIIISITVLVVAVPEGLPLAVTISLAFSVKKMLNDNNLVRHLHACETMGNATAICSDKTGTLTTNRMTVVQSYAGGSRYNVTPRLEDLPQSLVDLLKVNIAVNSSYTSQLLKDTEGGAAAKKVGLLARMARWVKSSNSEVVLGQGLARQVGNVTECALLGFLVDLNIDYEAIREQFPTDNFTKVYTFNSSRKSMSTVIALPNGGYRLFTKGASEIVLAKCSSTISQDGKVSNLSKDDQKDIVTTVVTPMAENALRTIALAYRDFPPAGEGGTEITSIEPEWDDEESIVNNLTLLAIVGIQDPVRPEVPGCIESCQNAGITVRMVTGDNIDTARAIAFKCGIINKGDGYLVMEGKEFNKKIRDQSGEINPEKFDRIWPHLRVLARSSPTDKHILVDGIIQSRLTKNREVVAVTGDGTNDGPALKRADVGFAMGIAGTDVAKEACDIILIDDNFASIVRAVMWGRNVYDSISKFLQFQLTVNVVAVVLALISAITIGDTPLRAVQLLWVNLIMDTLASLALSTESPTPHLLERKPYGRNKALVSPHMWLFILGHSLYQLAVMFVLLYAGPMLFDIDDGKNRELRATPGMHFTLIFNTFVFMQIFNEINARKVHGERNVFSGIFKNWIFVAVMIVQVSVQIIIAQFGSFVFNTSGLNWELWMWSIFIGSTELIVWQLYLFIPLDALQWLLRSILVILQLRTHSEPQDHIDYEENDPLDEETTPAQVLWMKSLTRLRTQIRVVNAFRSGLDSGSVWSGSIAHLHSTPVPARRYNKHPSGLETAV